MRATLSGLVFLALVLTVPAPKAHAAARAVMGEMVRISLSGRKEMGIGIRANAAGWRMTFRGDATSIELVDQTGAMHDKWILPVTDQPLQLDAGRFQGGHAYRFELHKGGTVVERGLVYLYPTRAGRSARVEFEVEASGAAVADTDGIAVLPKSAL